MSTITIRSTDTHSTAVTDAEVLVLAGLVYSNVPPERVPVAMPAAIPADQAFYWSSAWQAGERESLEALRRGEGVVFDSDDPNDLARWLLSGDA